MNLEYWFPTGIWYDNLNIDNEPLKKFCLEEEQKHDSRVISNVGGWQSDSQIIFNKVFKCIRDDVEQKSQVVHANMRIRDDMEFKIVNGWININRSTDSNITHNHPGADLSCCYYINVPEGLYAPIVFEDPRSTRLFTESGRYVEEIDQTFSVCEYTPENGKILFFPSWLKHWVRPSNSNEPRISVAMNLNLIKK